MICRNRIWEELEQVKSEKVNYSFFFFQGGGSGI